MRTKKLLKTHVRWSHAGTGMCTCVHTHIDTRMPVPNMCKNANGPGTRIQTEACGPFPFHLTPSLSAQCLMHMRLETLVLMS